MVMLKPELFRVSVDSTSSSWTPDERLAANTRGTPPT
jgi:hypothetical protein